DGTVKCIDNEIPFEIPESWEWVRGYSCFNPMESTKPTGNSFRYIDIDAINNKKHKVTNPKTIKIENTPSRATRKLSTGDTLFSMVRPYLKNIAFIDNSLDDCIASTGFYVCKPNNMLFPEFCFNLMTSKYIIDGLNSFMKGDNSPSISNNNILNWLYPIPPFEEQIKIVHNIERYNHFIDEVELNQIDLQKTVNQTKSKILDLAIRGKLVPQDPNDEPASVLLERIKAEHPESKKKAKYTGDNSHYPFEIPKSWEWSTIGEISQHNTGKTLHKGRNSGTPYQYITTSNLYWDSFVLDNLKEMPFEEKELDKFSAIKGDLLICEGGDGGRSAIWTEEYAICFQNHIHRVRPFCDIKSKYIYFFMLYSSLKGSINDYKKGIGIQSLSSSSLASIRLSLPPIEEQKRIVKKIEDIFDSLNEIENSIKLKRKL
ncbi:TPA: hypothetical protein JRX35_003580, partial [Elizabethkingia anophelis]|nr:hypothetical protein [Elizabethkingia anophelis]